MPQLVPFYFVNQLVYGLSFLFILLVIASQYFLPRLFFIFLSRIFITKL
uniref:ATP synthase protein 8 n=1 Tax=Magnusiomyces magnusii TaxID=43963 RepID=K9L360_MAGMU|nr:Atp8p [Magnusiomyces magnusii]AEY71963.2 Atp8p [Magnusiomyces magnusii]AHY04987.1 ATP synthase F0 subunit 8 [Magnusiomyces magnusii]